MTTQLTETTFVETTLTAVQIAEDFVKESTTSGIVDELVIMKATIEKLEKQIENKDMLASNYRTELRKVVDTVDDFIKEHVKENDSASVRELKELAAELDIELTKNITVTFTIEVEAELTVPLDFDEEDINDGDFKINIEYKGTHDDVECDDLSTEVDDFSAEEN